MINFSLSIEDHKFAEFKTRFLVSTPVPIDEETGEPLFTENQWIKEYARRHMQGRYRKGKIKEAQGNAVIDDNIIS